uniref:Uncharacterized protein n=1 Tax=Anguilla anguilla TaxID=7936 RepID=A0A0E9WZ57_ANGAN
MQKGERTQGKPQQPSGVCLGQGCERVYVWGGGRFWRNDVGKNCPAPLWHKISTSLFTGQLAQLWNGYIY